MGTVVVARWVSFDPVWQSLSEFLKEWKPSCTLAPHVEWICISTLRAKKINVIDTGGLMQHWDALCTSKLNDVDCTDVQSLAEEHDVMSGKWLIYVQPKEIDDAWCLIANAIFAGKLGTDAKVSTNHNVDGLDGNRKPESMDMTELKGKKTSKKNTEKSSSSKSHVICVYSSNFQDMDVVFGLREKLRDLGFKDRLSYKPDAYSFCGIYSGNQWGIPPTIYRWFILCNTEYCLPFFVMPRLRERESFVDLCLRVLFAVVDLILFLLDRLEYLRPTTDEPRQEEVRQYEPREDEVSQYEPREDQSRSSAFAAAQVRNVPNFPSQSNRVYVVIKGRRPGIYLNWEACHAQVNQYAGNQYKSFPSFNEAKSYWQQEMNTSEVEVFQ